MEALFCASRRITSHPLRLHPHDVSTLPHRQEPGSSAVADSPRSVQTLFFKFVHHRIGANAQDTRGIADAIAVERHVDNLLFDLG